MSSLIAILVIIALAALVWNFGPRRPSEPGFKFVYVNQDGSVRELSPAEQSYLSEEFQGGDGGRPYIKGRYRSRDGWGSISGFIERRYVPARIKVLPVHPDYDVSQKAREFDILGSHRAAGDIIETQADGSVRVTPNPKISRAEGFELSRSWHLADQQEREKLAAANHSKTNSA